MTVAVADPGFPVEGAPTRWRGANLRHEHFSAKTHAKTKELDPVGGGAPWIRHCVVLKLALVIMVKICHYTKIEFLGQGVPKLQLVQIDRHTDRRKNYQILNN